MDRTVVIEFVVATVCDILEVSKDTVQPAYTLEQLGADRLDRFELVIRCEDHFNIEISDERAEKIATIEDLITCVGECQQQSNK